MRQARSLRLRSHRRRVLQVRRKRRVLLALEPQALQRVRQLAEQAQRKPAIPVPDRLARRAFATALTLVLPWLRSELSRQRLAEPESRTVARLLNHLRSQSLNLRLDRVYRDGYDDDGACVLDRRCCRRQSLADPRGRFASDVDHRLVQNCLLRCVGLVADEVLAHPRLLERLR